VHQIDAAKKITMQKGLVNRSAAYFPVDILAIDVLPCRSCPQTKGFLMFICFVLSWSVLFLEYWMQYWLPSSSKRVLGLSLLQSIVRIIVMRHKDCKIATHRALYSG